MFEHLGTPEEIFDFKLGVALAMERTLVDALEELQDHARRTELKQALSTHRAETIGHVQNVEECFDRLGREVDDSPCPAVHALVKEARGMIRKTDDSLLDVVILAAAGEAEHHEIAVYEALIPNAEARGAADVASLLRVNIEQERHALHLVGETMRAVTREGIALGAEA